MDSEKAIKENLLLKLEGLIRVGINTAYFDKILKKYHEDLDLYLPRIKGWASCYGRWDITLHIITEHIVGVSLNDLYMAYIRSNLEVFKKLVNLGMKSRSLFVDVLVKMYDMICADLYARIYDQFVNVGCPLKGHFWIPKGKEHLFLDVIRETLLKNCCESMIPPNRYHVLKMKTRSDSGRRVTLHLPLVPRNRQRINRF